MLETEWVGMRIKGSGGRQKGDGERRTGGGGGGRETGGGWLYVYTDSDPSVTYRWFTLRFFEVKYLQSQHNCLVSWVKDLN